MFDHPMALYTEIVWKGYVIWLIELHTHAILIEDLILSKVVNPTFALCHSHCIPSGSDGKVSTLRETWVQSLGQEDLLEKEMATRSSTLA